MLSRPGPFNFSAFNNEAAATAGGEVLVFLNNDTEILTPDWLEQFANLAMKRHVGAVGGLLLFPNGRIQHSGIVVGLGEEAGHFEALQAPDAPSWLERNRSPHEASAVTAACLAVQRWKFEAVGGFDAENFPINPTMSIYACGLAIGAGQRAITLASASSTRNRRRAATPKCAR